MKNYILISLLLLASMVYGASPDQSTSFDDRILICLQPDISIESVNVQNATPITGLHSLDALMLLREVIGMEPFVPGATYDDMDEDVILANIYRIKIEKGRTDLLQLIQEFAKDPNILYAEPEYIRTTDFVPNDSQYSQQWFLSQVQAAEAWDFWDIAGGIEPGSKRIVLASNDTGVQYTHADLWKSTWVNQAEVPDSIFSVVDTDEDGWVDAEEVVAYISDFNSSGSINLQDAVHPDSPFMDGIDGDDWDNDATSFIDDLIGWDPAGTTSGNYPDNDPLTSGTMGDHGTHVAGLLGATTNNGLGVASVIFNGSIMPLKCQYDLGNPLLISTGYPGMLYAAKAGADIINNSWGGPGASTSEQATINVVTETYGALMIAAAGNDNSGDDHFPSAYDNVISVAATTTGDNKADFSNYGPSVDISSPGTNIRSTVFNNQYQSWPGTSMASPIVASCFGLLKSLYPEATNEWLIQSILESADPIDDMNPNFIGQLGSGRVNVASAIAHAIYPRLSFSSYSLSLVNDNGDGMLSPGEEALMRVNLFNEPGWVDAIDVTASLFCESGYITITDGEGAYGNINNGNIGINISNRFGFSVAADAPSGLYPMSLIVSANAESDNPYTAVIEFSIDVSIWQANFPIASSVIKGGNAVVDLNGDGSNEIIYSAYDSLLHAINAEGNEIAGFPVLLNYLAEATPSVGDIDNDGDLEVVVGSLDRNVYVIQHDGSVESIHVAAGFLLGPASLYDFDNDGDLEIVSVSTNDELAVMHHDGTMLENFPMTLEGNMTVGAAIGDINADGNVNIVVATWGDQLHAIHLDGTEAEGFPVVLAGHVRSAPILANLDASTDGSLEIIFGCNDNKLHAYDATGNELWYVSSSSQDIQADPSIADMDGDGDFEIFVGGLDRLIYGVDHTGTFLEGWPVGTGGAIYSSPALADIDDDGLAEVFIGSNDRSLYGLHLDGSNIGGFPVENSGNIQGSPTVADLDGDSDLEIIVGSDDNLLVMDLSTNGETESYWPTHRGNLHRTGLLLTAVGVDDERAIPSSHKLYANYPNPFNPSTSFAFDIAEATHVTLQILDIRGRVVKELVSARMSGGNYHAVWDGKHQGRTADAGVYFYRLTTQDGDLVRKMTLLK